MKAIASSCDQCDRRTLHAFRHVGHGQLLTNTCEDDQRQGKTDGDRDRIDDRLQEIVIFLNHQDSHTQYTAVRGDQRQEDTQRLIEGGRDLLEDDLHHLYQGSDDQDETDGLHEAQTKSIENILLNQEGNDR